MIPHLLLWNNWEINVDIPLFMTRKLLIWWQQDQIDLICRVVYKGFKHITDTKIKLRLAHIPLSFSDFSFEEMIIKFLYVEVKDTK